MSKIKFHKNGQTYEYDTEIRENTLDGCSVQMTSYHTVVDPTWSAAYLLDVQEAEREAGRMICGARTKDDIPCKNHPIRLENEPYPDEIGRCKVHRPSMQDDDEVALLPAIAQEKGVQIKSPTLRAILSIADDMYLNCLNCNIREVCDESGNNKNRCVKEKNMFETMLADILTENNLDTFADQAVAISVVDTFIKMIRTTIHESQYGLSESLARGTAQYNAKLKELLYKGLKVLGLDRKTRISIRHGDGRTSNFDGSIARALSNANVTEIDMKSAKMKLRRKDDHSVNRRTGPPIGLDGKVIKDDVPFETSD